MSYPKARYQYEDACATKRYFLDWCRRNLWVSKRSGLERGGSSLRKVRKVDGRERGAWEMLKRIATKESHLKALRLERL